MDAWDREDRAGWDELMAEKPPRCPSCGGSKVAYVLWGLPAMSRRLRELEGSGDVVIAGCMIPGEPHAPAKWLCRSCGYAWGLDPEDERRGLTAVGPVG
jgi:rubrerythrin